MSRPHDRPALAAIAKSPVMLVLIASAALAGEAPDPSRAAMGYFETHKKNADLMREYSWKQRIVVEVEGEQRPPKMYHVRFDREGELQKTLLTQDDGKKKRGIRGKIQKKKQTEFREWAGSVADVVKKYTAAPPGRVLEFLEKATVMPADGGQAEIRGTGFAASDDQVTIWIDRATRTPSRMKFRTLLDEEALQGSVEYELLDDGLRYAARTTIEVPVRDVKATVETFDYLKQ